MTDDFSQAEFLEELANSLKVTQDRLTRLENEAYQRLLAGGTDARLGGFGAGVSQEPTAGGGVEAPAIILGDGAVVTESIAPGAVTAGTFDTVAPAVPTGLTLSSDVVSGSDGTPIVRLTAELTHPADADYFGSYIEITRDDDGAETPAPIWTDSVIKLLLGKESIKVTAENVAGATTYWARAFSFDVQGNKSAYTSIVSTVTVADGVAPAMPTSVTAAAGFKGVALAWASAGESDLMLFEVRWGTNDTTWPDKSVTQNTLVWVPGLTPGTLYYFQVRAVDYSGNVDDGAGGADNYNEFPDSGWTASVSATPSNVGAADLAVNSVSAAAGHIADLNADKLTAGKLTLRPSGGMTALELKDAGGAIVGSWDVTNGIKVFGVPSSDYAHFDDAYLRFYKTGNPNAVAEIGPEGVVADSIRLGVLSGGHNVILNSSFEGAAFTTGTSFVVFTDATATPGWKAANRTTTPDNMTEGTTLTPTTVSF